MEKTNYEITSKDFTVGSAYELYSKMIRFLPLDYQEIVLHSLSTIKASYFNNPKTKFIISNDKKAFDVQVMKLFTNCNSRREYTKFNLDKTDSQIYIWYFKEKNINYIFVVVYLNKDILGAFF